MKYRFIDQLTFAKSKQIFPGYSSRMENGSKWAGILHRFNVMLETCNNLGFIIRTLSIRK